MEPMRALFMGRGLVLAAVSETWTSTQWPEPPIGLPVSEAWCDEAWEPVRALMREVYATGVPYSTIVPGAVVMIVPVRAQGRIVGVVTERVAVAPTPLPVRAPVGLPELVTH